VSFRKRIEIDALAFMDDLPKEQRRAILGQLHAIREYPQRHSDYVAADAQGRLLDVCVFEKYAIHFWTDWPDRHVKILQISWADR
jgi:hypothetical protein